MNKFNRQYWAEIKWNLPEGWEGPCSQSVSIAQYNSGAKYTWANTSIIPHGLTRGKYEITVEINTNGFIAKMFVPLTLIVE